MQTEKYAIVIGVVVAIIVLLIAATFILILVTYSNNRKKKFYIEKQQLQLLFAEQLLQSQLEMQEQTFNSISAEIHDNVGQTLSLAKVQVNILEAQDPPDLSLLAGVKESISKALADLRDIAKSLNADRLRASSLPDMIGHELQRIHRLGIIQTNLVTEGTERQLPEQKKLIILRLVQESLQNILKHAAAKNICASCKYETDHLELSIADDGLGFNHLPGHTGDGLGLQHMQKRAAMIGGRLSINSCVNQGTTIRLILNYE